MLDSGEITVDTDYYDLGYEAAVNGVEVLAYLDYPLPHREDWLAGWTDARDALMDAATNKFLRNAGEE